MFHNREDAGKQLARRLKGRDFCDPLVLAIPRGGIILGAVLARALDAELDVVLARKLRAPLQPEFAVGAVGEDGQVYLNHQAEGAPSLTEEYLSRESRYQLNEIARRATLFRAGVSPASIRGRSVIVTDDGIATGSTIIAALHVINGQGPYEVIVGVPVASPERLAEIERLCDEVVCLSAPEEFWAIGQFYEDFTQVEDAQVVELLRKAQSERCQPEQLALDV